LQIFFYARWALDEHVLLQGEERDTVHIRGFGFLEMPDRERAQAAIRSLHGSMLNGCSLRVNEGQQHE
jgi:RNA recognition motif-containing protein